MSAAPLTSDRQDWETPPDLFAALNAEFGFTLDPCCEESTAKCPTYFTVHDNGLAQSWAGHRVFCNPPYGRHQVKWIAKAVTATRRGDGPELVVLLIPSRTDTKVFHDYVLPYATQIRFLRGRVRFWMDGQPAKETSPFPSMVVVLRRGQDGRSRQDFILTKKAPATPVDGALLGLNFEANERILDNEDI